MIKQDTQACSPDAAKLLSRLDGLLNEHIIDTLYEKKYMNAALAEAMSVAVGLLASTTIKSALLKSGCPPSAIDVLDVEPTTTALAKAATDQIHILLEQLKPSSASNPTQASTADVPE